MEPLEHVISREFYETYSRLAPNYRLENVPEKIPTWEELPQEFRDHMVAVVSDLLERRVITA